MVNDYGLLNIRKPKIFLKNTKTKNKTTQILIIIIIIIE